LSWFSAVAEVPIRADDFRKSRLGRTSRYYRQALAWARLLLQGSDLPAGGGQVPPLVLDTHEAFEKFAEAVARAALPDGWQAAFQHESVFLTGQETQKRQPDILFSDAQGAMVAVGDVKYKEVLEGATDAELETSKGVLARIQAADWNQLYVYMRMKKASCGFFIVPFWKADGEDFKLLREFQFAESPRDATVGANVRVAVLALNLLRPLKM
jgi:5-methylcytosine-specific restriction enzyme subunit McrC